MPRSVESRGQQRQLLSEIARWRGLGWIVTWLGVVCLLLSLGLDASAHHPPQVARNRSDQRSRALVSLSFYQIFFPSFRSAGTKFIHSRAGPWEAFAAPNFFLRADDVDPAEPPWLEYGAPPGTSWGSQARL
jgi:hypothetical protein